jgi:hypothetical protein
MSNAREILKVPLWKLIAAIPSELDPNKPIKLFQGGALHLWTQSALKACTG